MNILWKAGNFRFLDSFNCHLKNWRESLDQKESITRIQHCIFFIPVDPFLCWCQVALCHKCPGLIYDIFQICKRSNWPLKVIFIERRVSNETMTQKAYFLPFFLIGNHPWVIKILQNLPVFEFPFLVVDFDSSSLHASHDVVEVIFIYPHDWCLDLEVLGNANFLKCFLVTVYKKSHFCITLGSKAASWGRHLFNYLLPGGELKLLSKIAPWLRLKITRTLAHSRLAPSK